ncbi:TonB-dependent receptor [Sphingomonas edaphi]|uniref:TonB-dependent receptor n=1 Tax=Sphingomonas edaphi TaxID=2315689 RepID=A0A418PZ15_9SPHN|nr:TonB-dependent receptor [Sphingomonas edaphi]RIX27305.1 TonB-dependent receptor [Sphingomonas edaphi]
MTDRTIRALTLSLLATTALAEPAFAQDTTTPPTEAAPATTTAAPADEDNNVIIVTATKREENLQDVPVSIQAIGTRRLDQLNISNFEDFTKQLPSVSFQTAQPGFTTVYMRGVASGGDGNHSGSFPSVGFYLDEQPVTTIGGTLDVHIYDVARIESLAGPQGTLYGASSQAGTIRIITNKPEIGVLTGRVDAEINKVAHGGWGGSLEGMINVPISDRIAFRGVAFYQRDAGYIDNVFGSRTYTYTGVNHPEWPSAPRTFDVDNEFALENNFNDLRTYGGRAALKIDLDDNWTVTPTIMHQNMKAHGVFYMDAAQDDLEVVRFRDDEISKDKFTQAALTIEGKIGNFDITYAGAYMTRPTYGVTDYTDYTDAYDAAYEGLLDYAYSAFFDNDGNVIDPRQYITGGNHFKKLSQELRIASPTENRFRVIAGAFFQRQSNNILQEYRVDGLADELSVNGYPTLLWLTKQKRVDKDYAVFGEASFDLTPQITLTAGGRFYKFDNTLIGFAGFGKNPAFDEDQLGIYPPPNAVWGSSGVRRCLTVNGLQWRDDEDSALIEGGVSGTPCTNVGNVVDGKLVPRRSKDNGFIHRLNAQYKPTDDLMFYATWSRGFRPGGINRQPNSPAYDPDFLTNYELGWKTTFGPIRWNGAIYHQKWKEFQFSFLGENSLTVIQNGRDARVNGIETDISYASGGLSINAAAAYTDAKTKGNICNFALGNSNCDGLDDGGDPDFVVTPSGTRLPVTPKFKASTTARYSWPMATGRAHVQAGLSYQGSAAADLRQDVDGDGTNPNDFLGRIKSSTIVDLFAGYDWRKYNVQLFVTNLFDERNELSRFVVCSICTQTKIVPGRPRTIGLRLGAKF